MRRGLALFAWAVALAVWIGLASATAAEAERAVASDPFPGVAAAYEVRIDGRPQWSVNADRPLPPASLTKVMTALLALEAGRPDDVVVVSVRAAAETGARLGLAVGDRMRASALLAAMLIRSANDACVAIAEWVAGSEPAFVARMNARAATLGLTGTHFTNACGHDGENHVATAADLARLASIALEQPEFARLVAMESALLRTEGGRRWRIANTNALLGRVPGVRGVKSGYTKRAGTCLIVDAERDGHRVLIVLLGAADRWWDAAAIVERTFDVARAAPRRG
jgi:serine-type D-Ala-D-Ala carboxypeptidase (penicillin-binding protein 5/6)